VGSYSPRTSSRADQDKSGEITGVSGARQGLARWISPRRQAPLIGPPVCTCRRRDPEWLRPAPAAAPWQRRCKEARGGRPTSGKNTPVEFNQQGGAPAPTARARKSRGAFLWWRMGHTVYCRTWHLREPASRPGRRYKPSGLLQFAKTIGGRSKLTRARQHLAEVGQIVANQWGRFTDLVGRRWHYIDTGGRYGKLPGPPRTDRSGEMEDSHSSAPTGERFGPRLTIPGPTWRRGWGHNAHWFPTSAPDPTSAKRRGIGTRTSCARPSVLAGTPSLVLGPNHSVRRRP